MCLLNLTQYCADCGGWFDKDSRKLKRELRQTANGDFLDIIFCPECNPGQELKDAAEYGIQTPYQKAICTVIAGEILMYEERIEYMKERIRRYGGET